MTSAHRRPMSLAFLAACAAGLLALLSPAASQAMATHEVGALHHTPYTPVLTQAHRRPTLLVARAWSRPRLVRAPARGTFHRLAAVRLAARLKR